MARRIYLRIGATPLLPRVWSRKQCAHMKQCYGATAKLREDCSGVPSRASIALPPPPTSSLPCGIHIPARRTHLFRERARGSHLSRIRSCLPSRRYSAAVEFQLRKTMPGDTRKTARNNVARITSTMFIPWFLFLFSSALPSSSFFLPRPQNCTAATTRK